MLTSFLLFVNRQLLIIIHARLQAGATINENSTAPADEEARTLSGTASPTHNLTLAISRHHTLSPPINWGARGAISFAWGDCSSAGSL